MLSTLLIKEAHFFLFSNFPIISRLTSPFLKFEFPKMAATLHSTGPYIEVEREYRYSLVSSVVAPVESASNQWMSRKKNLIKQTQLHNSEPCQTPHQSRDYHALL